MCKHIAAIAANDLAITILSVEEQLSGWYTYLRKATQTDKVATAYQGLTDTVISVRAFAILTFDESAILRYESLRKLKLNVRKMDLRIAAVVLEKGATGHAQCEGLQAGSWIDFRRLVALNGR